MAAFKAILSFVEVFLLSIGIFPVNADIIYGSSDYQPPQVTTPMYIAQNSKTDFVIVTENEPDECILTAVDEMQTYIEKISGTKPEYITETEYTESTKAIIIGETELEESITDVDRSQIGADGFILYSNGDCLLIAGGDSRGTIYGVYTVIEEYFGVRWFTPELEVIPESRDFDFD